MPYHFPIFNEVEACIYKGSKNWGARDTSAVNVKVGTSKSNSHLLVTHYTKRKQLTHGFTRFTFGYQIPGRQPHVVTTLWHDDKTQKTYRRMPKVLRERIEAANATSARLAEAHMGQQVPA